MYVHGCGWLDFLPHFLRYLNLSYSWKVTGSHCVILADWNSLCRSGCPGSHRLPPRLCLLNTGIKGVYYHTWQSRISQLNMELEYVVWLAGHPAPGTPFLHLPCTGGLPWTPDFYVVSESLNFSPHSMWKTFYPHSYPPSHVSVFNEHNLLTLVWV